jgi:hypothetical protein
MCDIGVSSRTFPKLSQDRQDRSGNSSRLYVYKFNRVTNRQQKFLDKGNESVSEDVDVDHTRDPSATIGNWVR